MQNVRMFIATLALYRTKFLTLIFLIGVSFLFGALVSNSLWGYAITPPASHPLLERISTITTVNQIQFSNSMAVEVMPFGTFNPQEFVDYPPARILPLIEERLPDTSISLDPELLTTLSNELLRLDIDLGIFSTQSAYQIRPSGYLVIGEDKHGEQLLYVNLTSAQISDDYYGYHEELFSVASTNDLELLSENHFNYAVAGIEFANFWALSLSAFTLLCLLRFLLIIIGKFGSPKARNSTYGSPLFE